MPACGDVEKVGGSSARGLRVQSGPRLMAHGPKVAGFSGSIIPYNRAAMPLGSPQSPHLTSCRCSMNGHLSTASVWSLEADSWEAQPPFTRREPALRRRSRSLGS